MADIRENPPPTPCTSSPHPLPNVVHVKTNICVLCAFPFIEQHETATGTTVCKNNMNRKLKLSNDRVTAINKVVDDCDLDLKADELDNTGNGICKKCFRKVEHVVKMEESVKLAKAALKESRKRVKQQYDVNTLPKNSVITNELVEANIPIENPIPVLALTNVRDAQNVIQIRPIGGGSQRSILPIVSGSLIHPSNVTSNSCLQLINDAGKRPMPPNISKRPMQPNVSKQTIQPIINKRPIQPSVNQIQKQDKILIQPNAYVSKSPNIPLRLVIDANRQILQPLVAKRPIQPITDSDTIQMQPLINSRGQSLMDTEVTQQTQRDKVEGFKDQPVLAGYKVGEDVFTIHRDDKNNREVHIKVSSNHSGDQEVNQTTVATVTCRQIEEAETTVDTVSCSVEEGENCKIRVKKEKIDDSVQFTSGIDHNPENDAALSKFCVKKEKTDDSVQFTSGMDHNPENGATMSESCLDVPEKKSDVIFSSVVKQERMEDGGDDHQCNLCGEIFQLYSDLELHCEQHHLHVEEEMNPGDCEREKEMILGIQKTLYQCSACQQNFTDYAELQKHCEVHVREMLVQVSDHTVLPYLRLDDSQPTNNSITKRDIKPHRCDVCGEIFSESLDLLNHLMIHDGHKIYQCEICNQCFDDDGSLMEHVKVHITTGKRPFKCDVCGKSFKLGNHLLSHLDSHTIDQPFKCDVCQKSFKRISMLNRHKKIHVARPFGCDMCSKSFREEIHLKLHVKVHREKPFKCEVCHKGFKINATLKIHAQIHTKDWTYKCCHCEKCFGCRASRRAHINTHHGGRFHVCEICSKSFKLRGQLRNHMLVHTGVKAYKCDDCGKSFSIKRNLQRHSLIHTDVKPHSCDICNKSFRTTYDLTGHKIVHSGHRKYKCKHCSKAFYHNRSLVKHLKFHIEAKD